VNIDTVLRESLEIVRTERRNILRASQVIVRAQRRTIIRASLESVRTGIYHFACVT
jgi:hypothetical protein